MKTVLVFMTALCLTSTAPVAATTARVHSSVRIVVDHRRVMVDQAVRIRLRGLASGERIELRLRLERGDATTWTSSATFQADAHGRVDVASMAPVQGDYEGVDPMGLLWSAHLDAHTSPPPALAPWTDEMHLSALIDGRQVATALVTRSYLRRNIRVSAVRDRGLVGTMFEPQPSRHRPTLIVVGGSEGGMVISQIEAAMFASHGYNALALAYFDPTGTLGGGLPTKLSLVPLEYFGTAIDWLGAQPSVDPNRIGFVGSSKGAELALLVGSRYPQIKTVVAYAPSNVAWAGLGASPADREPYTNSSWSEHGQPVPFLEYAFGAPTFYRYYRDALDDHAAVAHAAIPVERIHGPVLLVSGRADALWPSSYRADQVISRLHAHHHPYPDEHLAYDAAGHGIFFPYEPTTQIRFGNLDLGGSPAANARADREHWPILLDFLADNLSRTSCSCASYGRRSGRARGVAAIRCS